MRMIAVCLDGAGQIAKDVEDCQDFTVYEVEGEEVVQKQSESCYGVELDAKIAHLRDRKIQTLFISDVTDRELDAFGNYGIEIFINCEGSADEIVARYLSGDLEETNEPALLEETERDEFQTLLPPPRISALYAPELPMNLAHELAFDHLDQAQNPQYGYQSEYEASSESLEEVIEDDKKRG